MGPFVIDWIQPSFAPSVPKSLRRVQVSEGEGTTIMLDRLLEITVRLLMRPTTHWSLPRRETCSLCFSGHPPPDEAYEKQSEHLSRVAAREKTLARLEACA
jgi:hypothetical protein